MSEITVAEVKDFLEEAKKYKENWEKKADKSWAELKKSFVNKRLWSITPNSVYKSARYPAWYSIYKIRQPLILSRIGIPIGKDTTQDGNDNIGATAAICMERLAVSLARSFNFFDYLCSVRDDGIATNFGFGRAYYCRETRKQKLKERIEPVPVTDKMTGEQRVIFVDGAGNPIDEQEVGQDDEGFFIEHDEVIDIENEEIRLEHSLYKDVYVDPDIRRWEKCKRLAFVCYYSKKEFQDIFGVEAMGTIKAPDQTTGPGDGKAEPKLQRIKVFEYWDLYEKEVKWLAENGEDFITPSGYYYPDPDGDGDVEGEELNGLYDLRRFFPCPEPLVINQPTDDFWPVPEYFQLIEIFQEIHTLFARLMAVVKAIRPRILFDASIPELQPALNEASDGDAFGVTNLAQALANNGGSLQGAVQAVPIEMFSTVAEQLYNALESRLQMVFKLSGTGDILQGLITDPTDRTFGERQMLEKYALNQLAEAQRKMAEFTCDCYQLMCEMALKNFKDASLDMYIMPQTLQPEDQQRYKAALELLKTDTKRFRIELETDSTIALNEQYDKQMRVELVNALTTALEKTANTAQTSPALVVPELHCLKFLVQGFRQGKLFQSEITESIDNVIKMAEQAEPAFNKDAAAAQAKAQELQLKAQEMQQQGQIDVAKIQSDKEVEIQKLQVKMAELAQNERLAGLEVQIKQFQAQVEEQEKAADVQFKYQELAAGLQKARDEMQMKSAELFVELRKVADQKEASSFENMLNARVKNFEMQLANAYQMLESQKMILDEREKYMTEARLQSEHKLQQLETMISMANQAKEAARPAEPPVHIHMPTPPKPPRTKKRVKIERDAMGTMTGFDAVDESVPE